MKSVFIIAIFLSLTFRISAQKSLQIIYQKFGKVKKYEIPLNDFLEYKLKGENSYHLNKIVNLQDSFIVFSNDSVVKLSQIKTIRLKTGSHLLKTLQNFFMIGGAAFVVLNTTNNLINNRNPAIDPSAVYISAGLFGAGLIIREATIKRIRITKNKTLKIMDIDFENLNTKEK